MTNLKVRSSRSPLRPTLNFILTFFLLSISACGYHVGSGSDLASHADSTGAGRTLAIPLFENATFEPILEKRITEAFKETFFLKGWKVVSDPSRASMILTGRILRFERIPVSLRQDGQAEEFRVKIGMELRVLPSEKGQTTAPLKRETEGIADYIAKPDVAADRSAEDRAIREAGRKMAEQAADLLPTKNFFKPEPKVDAQPQPTLPAKE